MEEIVVIKGPNNALLPATDEDAARIAKYRLGQGVTVRTTAMGTNSLLYHQKTIMLFKLCYDVFCERVDTGIEYKGRKVQPAFEVFRKELTVLSGHYDAVYSLNGSFRLIPKSISYAKCTDEEKEKIYSSVINAALKNIYNQALSEDELRSKIDQLMAFDK